MAEAREGELEDEMFGNLRPKRSRSKSGYYGVTKVKSAKNPFQAWIKSATRQQQSLGCFATAKEAAIRVAAALAQAEGEDLDSPRKQSRRGVLCPRSALTHYTLHAARRCILCVSVAACLSRQKGPRQTVTCSSA